MSRGSSVSNIERAMTAFLESYQEELRSYPLVIDLIQRAIRNCQEPQTFSSYRDQLRAICTDLIQAAKLLKEPRPLLSKELLQTIIGCFQGGRLPS